MTCAWVLPPSASECNAFAARGKSPAPRARSAAPTSARTGAVKVTRSAVSAANFDRARRIEQAIGSARSAAIFGGGVTAVEVGIHRVGTTLTVKVTYGDVRAAD